jgi:hypothetical protein
MPTTIFGRTPQPFGGAFSSDSTFLVFSAPEGSTINAAGLLVQDINVGYEQRITKVYEIGSRAIYYFRGPSEGRASISRVLGPLPLLKEFYARYGNVCNAGINNLTFVASTGCQFPAPPTSIFGFTLTGVVINAWNFRTQAENMVLYENLNLMFTDILNIN